MQRGSGLPRARRGHRLRGAARRGAGRRGDRRPRPAAAARPSGPRDTAVLLRRTSGSTRSPSSVPTSAGTAARRARPGTPATPPSATAAAERGARVALGHTLDDQAETVLLGLGRGSGPRSVAGMVEHRETGGVAWWRPAAGRPPGDDPRGLRGLGAAGLGRPVERRPRLHAGRGCAPRCCRCSTTCSAAASPPRWPAPPGCCGRTSTRSTPSPRPSWRPPGRRTLPAADVAALPDALRRRVLRGWLRARRVPDLQAVHLARRRRAAGPLARAGPGRPTRRRGRRPGVWQAGLLPPDGRGERPATCSRRSRGAPSVSESATHDRSTGPRPRLRPGHRPRAAQRGADPGQDRASSPPRSPPTTPARRSCWSASSRARCCS